MVENYDLAELIAQLLEIEERIPEKWRKRALPMEINLNKIPNSTQRLPAA